MNLKGKDFLKLLDLESEDILSLVALAEKLKAEKKAGIPHRLCEGKNIALIFEKTSTRTRCSFEVAARDLGMGVTYLDPSGSQIGKKESIADTARVLSGMFDGIEYRGYGQQIVEELAHYASVPVWNGLTNEFHPTQIIADMLTIKEQFGYLKGINLVYMGDARYNMGNSLMIASAMLGLDFRSVAPRALWTSDEIYEQACAIAERTGARITRTEDVDSGVKGCDFLYSDVWVSMGEPEDVWQERINLLTPYRIDSEMMRKTGNERCAFLHCLPSFHNRDTIIGEKMYQRFGLECMEVSDEVFESPNSLVFAEAANRMHTIKAVMVATLADVPDDFVKQGSL